MSIFDDVVARAQAVYPDVKVAFKDESTFMKILGMIMFFNRGFMTSYITTIGSTIYFPTREYVQVMAETSTITLLHELTHVYDSKHRNQILFSLLYLLPQLLVLLAIPLLFLFGWKIALFALVFLLPLPSYFRMESEKKAYTISMYVINKMNAANIFDIDLNERATFYGSQFKNFAYFLMWPFKSIETHFNNVASQLKLGNRPVYEAELFDLIDKLLGL